MTKATAVVVVFLAMLAVVAGLYATGPKYKLYCPSGSKVMHIGGFAVCEDNSSIPASLRRTNAWERVYFAVVGSKDTRG